MHQVRKIGMLCALATASLAVSAQTRRTRETLEIAGFEPVLLAPGVTVAEIMDLVGRIYGRDEQHLHAFLL